MFHDGMALVDIAKKLGKPEGTVRRWKSTQNWDGNSKKKQGERSQKDKASVRKRGGQPGNKNSKGKQNAKGHGAPKGTQNALKHGGYSAVYWDTLDEDERELIESMPQDTVKSGDNLWSIARKYYGGSGSNWKKIYDANKSVIESTANRYRGGRGSDCGHWIYPGTVLTIPN